MILRVIHKIKRKTVDEIDPKDFNVDIANDEERKEFLSIVEGDYDPDWYDFVWSEGKDEKTDT